MALSMDEQRMLEEMERKLADDDPLLASRLTCFGRPGLSVLLKARRVQIILALLALILIAAVALVVYALAPFRTSFDRSLQGHTVIPHASQPLVPSARGAGAAVPR